LRGMLGTLGAKPLYDAMSHFETRLKAGCEFAEAEGMLKELKILLQETLDEIEQLKKNEGAG